MNDTDREALRAKIKQEISSLREHIEALKKTITPVEPDVAIGRLSRLDTMINQGVSNASLNQAKQRLMRLEMALREVDKDGFGECDECGEPIAMARLMAMPEARYCVECAS